MKERPILFSAPMVRAILEGRKTQTRRVIRRQPHMAHLGFMMLDEIKPGYATICGPDYPDGDSDDERCPFGMPGDQLWVRETWLQMDTDHWADPGKPKDWTYGQPKHPRRNAIAYRAETDLDGEAIRIEYGYKWRPSIFMPRWASRITLKVKSLSVQPVQEISEFAAQAEGFAAWTHRTEGTISARRQFQGLWEKLNGKGKKRRRSGFVDVIPGNSWESNPWVWVIEFSRL